ncbi:protein-L-isoaspartate O-methyltransferase [Legionella sp. W05-934-2]|uniref:protein-L-isoaspartate O-methyltransferase family protein n=1 Tax=Legionella sp. W05-934-2 TaxID=1198649 RepID=UPI0034620297
MIKQQLRTAEILDPKVLDLYFSIDRAHFVPKDYADFAYCDKQIPLLHEQRMLTPTEEGKILQNLNLSGHETVLEIGTGSGFLTAMLAKLAKKVISIDYFSDLTKLAESNLALLALDNVELITGDAAKGWLEGAPYDVVIMTAAIERIEESHRLQVLPGGKLFAIVGRDPIMSGQLHHYSHEQTWTSEELFETNIPMMIDKSKPKEFVF